MKQPTVYTKVKSIVIMTFALCTFIMTSSMAQGRFSVGAELAFPQDDWADFVGVGLGISGRYEAPINENFSWMATAGFLSFGEEDNNDVNVTIIPINGGVKYYFNGSSFDGFYAGAELGLNFVGGDADSETELGFAPQIGYHLPVVDISLRYSLVDDFDYVAFRVAYVFGSN